MSATTRTNNKACSRTNSRWRTVSDRDSGGEQSACALIDPGVEIGEGPSNVLMADHEGFAVGPRGNGAREVLIDRVLDEDWLRWTRRA